MATDKQRKAIAESLRTNLLDPKRAMEAAYNAIAAYETNTPVGEDVVEVAADAIFKAHLHHMGATALDQHQEYELFAKITLQAIGYAELVEENARLRKSSQS